MPQFFLNKRLIILLVSIIILVALIGFSLKEREKLSWAEQFVKDTASWAQTIVSRPASYVAGFFENVKDLQNTYEENKELKGRLDQLAMLEADVQRLKDENEKLQTILDKKGDLSKYKPIQATVIARNPDRWEETLIINKGEKDGLEKDMAVITAGGLIGKVKNTSPLSASVQLLSSTDPANRISAVINEKIYGTIEGYDTKKKLLLLKRIPYDAKVEKGEIVSTSGLGGVFPSGLPVGVVEEVVPDEFGLNQTAYVKPGADFYDIEHVMVAKLSMEKPDLDILEEEEE
ncbi:MULTISPECIES: rod shape-determining protein MreC [Bacillus]|uniref:Cell shape-determining protein MreC n=1 Tax=Bacillus infantis TaxID=324767 RepID=A0A5D4SWB4_9BACI|nr:MULTISPECIES: rod shape-determining protein MreC [Bacillus]MCK6204972.1 rod shape-determining protein MreC [Bacillus infantis]MCP1159950.1 rod shape-determining protein MreC [Bacillus infantis]PLR72783.1 rod shape-determining protein MreC [Bacillus sp. UMB0728]TYS66156.1 rod shape-determining protein MreC [Bacillus infantis]